MSSADIAILVVVGLLSFYGWHRGIVRSAFNFAGLTAGALAGALYLPRLLPDSFGGGAGTVSTVALVAIGAFVGKFIAGFAGRIVRPVVAPLGPLRILDKLAGLTLMFTAAIVMSYFAAAALLTVPDMPYTQSLNDSILLSTTNDLAPDFVINIARSIAGELGQKIAPWLELKSAISKLR
ncbi:MAG: hypothetical protein RIT32_1065 [Actinomycetota bacterium]|jgi:hypothetical protein